MFFSNHYPFICCIQRYLKDTTFNVEIKIACFGLQNVVQKSHDIWWNFALIFQLDAQLNTFSDTPNVLLGRVCIEKGPTICYPKVSMILCFMECNKSIRVKSYLSHSVKHTVLTLLLIGGNILPYSQPQMTIFSSELHIILISPVDSLCDL